MKLSAKTLILPANVVDYYLEKTAALHATILSEEADVAAPALCQLISVANSAVLKKTLAEYLPTITETGFFDDIQSWENGSVVWRTSFWTDELRFLYLYEVFHASLAVTLAEDSLAGRRDIKKIVDSFRDQHDLRVCADLTDLMKDIPEGAAARLRPSLEEVCRVNIGELIGPSSFNIWKALDYTLNKENDPNGLRPLLAKLVPLPYVDA